MNVDIARNPKQEEFFNISIEALYGLNDYRNLFYGGAIRGGKSFACLSVMLTAAKLFPGSRWHIFRDDFPALEDTTIPSMQKIIGNSPAWGWNRNRSNFYCFNRKTDSKIFFKGENISQDPDLTDLLGLETNGIMFEQMESISKKLWQIGNSRNGSWIIPSMPKPITLGTFNPTQEWVKDVIYVPWLEGKLEAPYYFMHALPKDNAFVTQDQYDNWSMLDERYQKQFIEGDWTNFDDLDNRWAFAFKEDKHVGFPVPDPNYDLILSFDFNRNPMCCSVIQIKDWQKFVVLKVYKLPNMGVDGICTRIKAEYPNFIYIVTGDQTGDTSSTLFEEEVTNYTIIQRELGLSDGQIQLTANPIMQKNRTLVNSILQHMPHEIHKEDAAPLIWDFKNVKATGEGKVDKGDGPAARKDPTKQADALDTYRYAVNKFLSDYLRIPES